MKHSFIIEQKPLMAILSAMQPICTKRTTINATNAILFQVGHKELVLKSTDLEVSLQSSYILHNADVMRECVFLVSGKRIFDVIKEFEGEIEFVIEDTQLLLKSGSVTIALNIKDANEFPPFPERIENLMHMESSFLLNLLGKVAFLIPQNNANPALNGLFMEIGKSGLTMTTTDGHCLAQVSTTQCVLTEPRTWLVPRRAIFEVKKIIEGSGDKEIFIGICGNQLVFSGESFNFFTKVLVDQFPQYSAILKKDGFKAATVDRQQLVKTLRRSACLLSGQFIATHFGFTPKILKVSMQNQEVGKLKEELPLPDFDGNDLDIRFYAPYLLSGLQSFSEDKVTFYLQTSAKPIIFESHATDHELLYLVMPVSPSLS
ncbi:MAG: DNA polymerase III subunit beta [Candidatus Dependentiae bacterium]|nr:DNA polymerase III subunit beta [Candidatus Dependentiae bacterium]